jgi:hypothetical protein
LSQGLPAPVLVEILMAFDDEFGENAFVKEMQTETS